MFMFGRAVLYSQSVTTQHTTGIVTAYSVLQYTFWGENQDSRGDFVPRSTVGASLVTGSDQHGSNNGSRFDIIREQLITV